MNRFGIALVSAFAASLLSTAASAKLIDFASEAGVRGERGVANGAVLNTAELGGLNLQFSAGNAAGASRAYFNAATPNGSPQGLGSCKKLNAAKQCSRHYDDTVSSGEWVQVGFLDGAFNVGALSFAGAGNASLGSSAGLIKITNSLNSVVSTVTMSFAAAAASAVGLSDWIRFEFVDTEFVVTQISDVPLPGGLPLLLSGLAGLGFTVRRRKA